MHLEKNPRTTRAVLAALAACAAAGCQRYEPSPLDLNSHRLAFEGRLLETEAVTEFARRLHANDHAAPAIFDLSDGLSLAEGEVLALFYNSELRLMRLRAGVALAEYENAGLWEDPIFGFDAAEVLSPANPFEYGLTLRLTIPISGRLEAQKDRADAAYAAELRRVVDAEWATRFEVRSAWMRWTAEQERVHLLTEALNEIQQVGTITDQLESAGELTRAEGRLIRVEIAQRRAELAERHAIVAHSRLELMSLMGLPPTASIDLIPAVPPLSLDLPADPLNQLIRSNTTLAIRRAEYQIAEHALRVEIRKQYPDITIGSGYGSEDDDRLLLGVSMPIPILNANKGGIAEARAHRQLARAAAEITYEQLAGNLVATQTNLRAAQEQRIAFESTIGPTLDQQAREVARLIELGEVNTLLLLETVTRRFDAKSRLIDHRVDELQSTLKIAQLLGPTDEPDPAPVTPTPPAPTGPSRNSSEHHRTAHGAKP